MAFNNIDMVWFRRTHWPRGMHWWPTVMAPGEVGVGLMLCFPQNSLEEFIKNCNYVTVLPIRLSQTLSQGSPGICILFFK